MPTPLFIATERFDPSDGEKWEKYAQWAKIPALTEVVSLDAMLCRHLINGPQNEDWQHIVCEDFRLDYFHDLDYLRQRTRDTRRRNVLGLYRNPEQHIEAAPASGNFEFVGYDLIDEQTQISALTNCGGFPDVFANEELNRFGLIDGFERAREVRRFLVERHPKEPHAQCEMYAVWRMNESELDGPANGSQPIRSETNRTSGAAGSRRSRWALAKVNRIMPHERKDVCNCGALENASKEPDHAIRWDEEMNEYYIAYGSSGGRMMIYYCPFCGGSAPESRRDSMFAHVTDKEEARIGELFIGLRTVADVVARFGPPDEEREVAWGQRSPRREGQPECGEVFRGLVYKGLSPVADIVFHVGTSESVRGTWIQKYVGPHPG